MKQIPGYDYLYATKDGRIYSKKVNKYLKISINRKTGYSQVHPEKRTKLVHRIIALTFLKNPYNLPCVCHRDNNPLNNRVSNLYWGTYSENTQQCIRDGRLRPRGKIPMDEFTINCLLYEHKLGKSREILKKKFNISNTHISKILRDHEDYV